MWMMWFPQPIKSSLSAGPVLDVKKLSQAPATGQSETLQLKYARCRKRIQICVLSLSGSSAILNPNRQSSAYKFQELEHWLSRKNLQFIDRVLHYKWDGKANRSLCLVVPQGLQRAVLHGCHDLKSSGHLGQQKTLERLKQNYNMSRDCIDYVTSCSICNQNKKPNIRPKASLSVSCRFSPGTCSFGYTQSISYQ